jgi:hypothetical protein
MIGHVDQSLCSGDIVNGRNASVLNSKVLHNGLDDGSEAIGRARRVGDQESFLGKQIVIATQDNIQGSCFLDGSRDNDLLYPANIIVRLQGCHREELSGAFHNHFHTQGLEINIGKVLFFTVHDSRIVDAKALAILSSFHCLVPRAVYTVVLCQVGGRLATGDIIHKDNIQLGIFPRITKDETSDTSETIDSALDRHVEECKK